MKDLYLECDCHNEIIRVERHGKEFWFSFWQAGFYSKEKYNLIERIILAFKVLKTGIPYTDMVILSNKQIEKLVYFLKEEK